MKKVVMYKIDRRRGESINRSLGQNLLCHIVHKNYGNFLGKDFFTRYFYNKKSGSILVCDFWTLAPPLTV